MSAPVADTNIVTPITDGLANAAPTFAAVVGLGVGIGVIVKLAPKAWRLVTRFF